MARSGGLGNAFEAVHTTAIYGHQGLSVLMKAQVCKAAGQCHLHRPECDFELPRSNNHKHTQLLQVDGDASPPIIGSAMRCGAGYKVFVLVASFFGGSVTSANWVCHVRA